MAITIKTVLS